jgi:formate hydrogenlyase subunit 4
MIGLSTDIGHTMTGRIRDVVTRIEQMIGPGVVRVGVDCIKLIS